MAKLGTEANPLQLKVQTLERQKEIIQLLSEHQLTGQVIIDAVMDENITDLTGLLNKPATTRVEKQPNRNDPCRCGSGKKYKKCCG